MPAGSDRCSACGGPLVPSTPREEITRDQGLICLLASETRQDLVPVLHCQACAAYRQHQFRGQEGDDQIRGGQTDGTSPPQVRDHVWENIIHLV